MAELAVFSEANDLPGDFSRDGLSAPFGLLTDAQCKLTLDFAQSGSMATPVVWGKGLAVAERFIFDIATRPMLINLLNDILGEDIILWGACLIGRRPGTAKPWHCDIESASPQSNFASVWVGLENTERASGMTFIRRSHRFGRTIQEVQSDHGLGRGEPDDEMVLAWAQEFDAESEIVRPDVGDGQAILCDGRIWHGSQNELAQADRTSLLLQYARGDASVYMPDLTRLEWPTRLIVDQRPPVIGVSGYADPEANLVVPAPMPGGTTMPITTFAQSLSLPLERDPEASHKPHYLFRGPTVTLQHMSCHVSVLEPGRSPHAPMGHINEELLIVLDGEAEIEIASSPDNPDPEKTHFLAGDFVYHPAILPHTLRNVGDEPVTYLMLKWRSEPLEIDDPLGSTLVRLAELPGRDDTKPMSTQAVLSEPTAFLAELHSHVTDLQPGASYPPHGDDYDVAIVLLQGQIETVGEQLTAPAIAYFARDQLHGMENVGDIPARYVVFELHGPELATRHALRHQPRSLGVDTADGKVSVLQLQQDALSAENDRLKADAAKMRAHVQWMRNSRSWRYTGPIRSALFFVRTHLLGLERSS